MPGIELPGMQHELIHDLLAIMNRKLVFGLLAIGMSVAIGLKVILRNHGKEKTTLLASDAPEMPWQAPDSNTIPHTTSGDQIRYGRDLIARTSYYLGPKG